MKEPKGLEKPRDLSAHTLVMRLEGGDAPRMKRLGLWDPLVRSIQKSGAFEKLPKHIQKAILEVKPDR